MHKNTHPFILGIRSLRNAEMVGKSIHKSTAEMPMARMHYHARLLVQHKHIVILMNNVQRNILRKNLQSPSLVRHYKLDHITRTDNVISLDYLVIHPYVFRLYRKLDPVAGSIFHMRRKILVHTHRFLTSGNVEAVMLEHLL